MILALAFAALCAVLGVATALRAAGGIDRTARAVADPVLRHHAAHLLKRLHDQAEGPRR